VVLLPFAQADGKVKARPAIALRALPGFGDWLVCGVSAQLHQCVAGFDETIASGDPDFPSSGLLRASVVRLACLQAVPLSKIIGRIGSISAGRHRRLLTNLSRHLAP
jgi:mRNA interferase MazF